MISFAFTTSLLNDALEPRKITPLPETRRKIQKMIISTLHTATPRRETTYVIDAIHKRQNRASS